MTAELLKRRAKKAAAIHRACEHAAFYLIRQGEQAHPSEGVRRLAQRMGLPWTTRAKAAKAINRVWAGMPRKQAAEKPAVDFYRSGQWRQIRYLALKNTEGRCQCCGATAADGVQIHVDHIKPRCEHPELALSLDNLQVLCEDCNLGKGAWDATDWRRL